VDVPPEVLAPISGAIGGGLALLFRTGVRWLRYRMLRNRVREEARGEPVFGTIGWLYNELRKESSARHVVERRMVTLGERVAHLEGIRTSQSGERLAGPNDTDPTDPPFTGVWEDEPRTPVEPSIARQRARRSRP
jgi:hypothetical protein